jgi:hypothetical protein
MSDPSNLYQTFIDIPEPENRQCRYCLDDGNQSDIIKPCNCIGSSEWIHRACLNRWRASSCAGDRFNRCEICLTIYEYEPYDEDESKCQYCLRKIKHAAYVAWDILLFLSFIQGVILSIALIILASGTDSVAQEFNMNKFAAAYLAGVIGFFAVIGLIGLLMSLTSNNNQGCNLCLLTSENGGAILMLMLVMIIACGIVIGIVIFFAYLKNVLVKRSIQSGLYVSTSIKIVKCRALARPTTPAV